MPCEMIQAEEANFSITMMGGLLGCPRSGYYAKKKTGLPALGIDKTGFLKG